MTIDAETILLHRNLNPPDSYKVGVYTHKPLLNFYGDGYLSGDYPDGVTRVDGVPSPASIRVLHRETGVLVSEVLSGADGTWRVSGLNTNMRFDVVGRKDGFNDVIVSNVQPVVEEP